MGYAAACMVELESEVAIPKTNGTVCPRSLADHKLVTVLKDGFTKFFDFWPLSSLL